MCEGCKRRIQLEDEYVTVLFPYNYGHANYKYHIKCAENRQKRIDAQEQERLEERRIFKIAHPFLNSIFRECDDEF